MPPPSYRAGPGPPAKREIKWTGVPGGGVLRALECRKDQHRGAGKNSARTGKSFARSGKSFPRSGKSFPRSGKSLPRSGKSFPRSCQNAPGSESRHLGRSSCGGNHEWTPDDANEDGFLGCEIFLCKCFRVNWCPFAVKFTSSPSDLSDLLAGNLIGLSQPDYFKISSFRSSEFPLSSGAYIASAVAGRAL